jgi:type III secretory pathway component EscV
MSEDKFDVLFLEIVENVLTEIFGVTSTRKMLQTMKKRYNLEVQEIPQEPGLFSHALRRILGKNHTVIEDIILENLCLKLKLKLKMKKDYTFSDYILDLRFESL